MSCILAGRIPGLLDAGQPGRVLRDLGSSLVFASMDPPTIPGLFGQMHPASLESAGGVSSRIVVELQPSGHALWRYIPLPTYANGVESEGVWPRTVNVCGQLWLMSLDQWDIYKLDAAYECHIPANGVPVITDTRRRDPTALGGLQHTTAHANNGSADEAWHGYDPMIVDNEVLDTSSTSTATSGSSSAHPVPSKFEVIRHKLLAKKAQRDHELRQIRQRHEAIDRTGYWTVVNEILGTSVSNISEGEKRDNEASSPDTSMLSNSASPEENGPLPEQAAINGIHKDKSDDHAHQQVEHDAAELLRQKQQEQEREIGRRYQEEISRKLAAAAIHRQGRWSIEAMMQYYHDTVAEFDSTKYNDEKPLSIYSIPWPLVTDPRRWKLTDITWESTEEWIQWAQPHLGYGEQRKAALEVIRNRFHPDRWQSRRRFAALPDEQLRTALEEAVNTVSQAITAHLTNFE